MFRFIYILIAFFVLVLSCMGQSDTSLIKEVVGMSSHFSNRENRFELHFDDKKETFVFYYYHNEELLKKIKLIKSDIHPEGIFIYESENEVYIRFLSIRNGSVFIEEKFVNGYRRGRSTNIVDIGNLSYVDRSILLKFVKKFKNIFQMQKNERPPVLISPPSTKN